MDTLIIALALLDGRAMPVPTYTPAPIVWAMERTATVRNTDSMPVQTRAPETVKTCNIWEVRE